MRCAAGRVITGIGQPGYSECSESRTVCLNTSTKTAVPPSRYKNRVPPRGRDWMLCKFCKKHFLHYFIGMAAWKIIFSTGQAARKIVGSIPPEIKHPRSKLHAKRNLQDLLRERMLGRKNLDECSPDNFRSSNESWCESPCDS